MRMLTDEFAAAASALTETAGGGCGTCAWNLHREMSVRLSASAAAAAAATVVAALRLCVTASRRVAPARALGMLCQFFGLLNV